MGERGPLFSDLQHLRYPDGGRLGFVCTALCRCKQLGLCIGDRRGIIMLLMLLLPWHFGVIETTDCQTLYLHVGALRHHDGGLGHDAHHSVQQSDIEGGPLCPCHQNASVASPCEGGRFQPDVRGRVQRQRRTSVIKFKK